MPSLSETESVQISNLTGSAAEFAAFCEPELERRRASEPDYDDELYNEAVKLVLRKLGALEAEGLV